MSERSLAADLMEAGEGSAWQWDRLPAQREFIASSAPFSMFSGGFACGKTVSLCAKVILLLLIPNNLGYLGRQDGKALRASTMQSLYDMLPKQCMAKHNDQRGFIQLKHEFGGGKLIYGDFKDLHDLKNLPLGFFAIDQAEEVSRDVWNYLVGRLRRMNPVLSEDGKKQYWVWGVCSSGKRHFAAHDDTSCRLCSKPLPPFDETRSSASEPPAWDMVCHKNYGFGVCNPEGPSHWIYQDFPGLPGQHGFSTSSHPGYAAYHATAWDGLKAGFVKEEYVAHMEARYRKVPLMWQRYLEGKWVEAEGLVYPGWNRDIHIINRGAMRYDGAPLVTNEDEMYEFVDHGLTAPTAVAWVVIKQCDCGCNKLDYYIVDEHYEGEKPVSYHAAAMKMHRERMPYKLSATYLDSQAFSRTLIGQKGTPREDELYSVADEYSDHQIYCVPNQKDWDAGYNRITEVLAIDPNHKHPITGEQGAPHLYTLSHCSKFQWEVEGYKWKKARGSVTSEHIIEEPVDHNDHLMDGLNGFLTSRPVVYIQPQEPSDSQPDWLIELDRATGGASHMALSILVYLLMTLGSIVIV